MSAPTSRTLLLYFSLALLMLASLAAAQTPLPDNFNPAIVGEIHALAIQADGRILVGGAFSSLSGQSCSNLAKLNPDGTLDITFRPSFNGPVYALALQEGGKILVGGSYTVAAGYLRDDLVRLHPDGTLDGWFNARTDGDVRALALQPDGRIIAGGHFRALNGSYCDGIGRLHPDGTLDYAFGLGNSQGLVNTVAIQQDGKIIMGGSFGWVTGLNKYRIARWHPNGTLDTAFNPGEFSHNSASVDALAVQPDGKILAGGTFTNLAGNACYRIARLQPNGALDTHFNRGANDRVSAFALQADGKIIVAGSFTTMSGQPRNRLTRFNPDGTLDESFNPGPNGPVNALAAQPDGKLLTAGTFTSLAGQPRTNLARLNTLSLAAQTLAHNQPTVTWLRTGAAPEVWRTEFAFSIDGAAWTSLGAGTRSNGAWFVPAISLPANATIRARGFLGTGTGNSSESELEQFLGPPVFLDHPLSQTLNAGENTTLKVRAGGTEPISFHWLRNGALLTDSGRITGSQAAILNITAAQRSDVGGYAVVLSNAVGMATSIVATVTILDPGIAVHPLSQNREPGQSVLLTVTPAGSGPFSFEWRKDGVAMSGHNSEYLALTNLVTGDAGSYSVKVCNALGCVTSSIVRLTINTAVLDSSFNALTSDNSVHALAGLEDGKLLAGGSFYSLGGQYHPAVARLNADGTADAGFAGRSDSFVFCLARQPDGKIIAGGSFTSLAGVTRNYLGRLHPDGTLDAGFNPAVAGWVFALRVLPDGRILTAGTFGLTRLQPDGTPDSSFTPTAGNLRTMALLTDGMILVGGPFTSLAGKPFTNVARFYGDGSLDLSFAPLIASEYWSSAVNSLAVQVDGKILVGGTFSSVDGQPRANLCRLNADGTLDLSFDPQVNFVPPGWPNWLAPSVNSVALQTDGGILITGHFNSVAGESRRHVALLRGDGSPDLRFNPVRADDTISEMNAVTLQPDGKALVGGNFKSFSGEARTNLVRLINPEPAVQQLTRGAAGVTWLRGGSSPEVWRTTFEHSADGTSWIALGDGSRLPEGWQLAGSGFPTGGTIRARGFLPSGSYNGSFWFTEALLGLPIFTLNPLSQTNPAGSTITLTGAARGEEPLTYQWFKSGVPVSNGPDITGATSPNLVLSAALKSTEGDYRLGVTNPSGSITSQVATLRIIDPVVLLSPLNRYAEPGQTATFNVSAAGTSLSYQWWKNGAPLPEATGPSLMLTNVQLSSAGSYFVVISNPFGSLTSAVATLTVNLATLDTEFNPAAGSTVSPIAVQPDGKILLGGTFTTLAGASRSRLARLNANGSLDTAFSPAANNTVYSLVVQSDGKILAGGDFTSLAGNTRLGMGRLNPNGTLDSSFNTTVFAAPPGYTRTVRVQAICLQPDGKVVIGGRSSLSGGPWSGFVYRLNTNGTTDTNFVISGTLNGPVTTLALQPDGKILVGGVFTYLRSATRNRLGRLNPNGTLDDSFNPDLDNIVNTVALQTDGRILVGGSFTTVAGETRTNLARLHPDGAIDRDFAPPVMGNSMAGVFSLAIETSGNILVAGLFSNVAGQPRVNLARLNSDAAVDNGFNPVPNNFVYGLAITPNGDILAGGDFSTIAGQARSRIAQLHPLTPAAQSLHYAGTSISWQRTGSSPEIAHATFEFTTNLTAWTLLGSGTRIPGGWQLDSVPALPTGRIRARGCVTSGGFNGSAGILEEGLAVGSNAIPAIISTDSTFAYAANRFTFNVSGPLGEGMVVEASTNLLSWAPVTTNTFTNSIIRFMDVNAFRYPSRFYRTRLH